MYLERWISICWTVGENVVLIVIWMVSSPDNTGSHPSNLKQILEYTLCFCDSKFIIHSNGNSHARERWTSLSRLNYFFFYCIFIAFSAASWWLQHPVLCTLLGRMSLVTIHSSASCHFSPFPLQLIEIPVLSCLIFGFWFHI